MLPTLFLFNHIPNQTVLYLLTTPFSVFDLLSNQFSLFSFPQFLHSILAASLYDSCNHSPLYLTTATLTSNPIHTILAPPLHSPHPPSYPCFFYSLKVAYTLRVFTPCDDTYFCFLFQPLSFSFAFGF